MLIRDFTLPELKRLHEHNTGLKRTPKQIENIKAAKRRPKIEAEC